MSKIELQLPAMGEGIIEATIIRWLKEEGEQIEEDEPVVEIATDKVDSEVPSPANGILHKKLFKDGDIPKVGDVIAIITTGDDKIISGDKVQQQETKQSRKEEIEQQEIIEQIKSIEPIESQAIKSRTTSGKFITPLVRKIAQEEGISLQELESIHGSGLQGRLTKDDVLNFLSSSDKPIFEVDETPIPETKKVETKEQIISLSPGVEIIEMDRMRKLIADHMVHSKQTSPHVTSFHEVDVTGIVNWRNKVKDEFLNREKEKLTFTPIFVEAVTKAIKDFPGINVSVDGNKILLKKNINIGMATALPNGNLIVPVIKNADQKNLIGLAQKVNDLAKRARINKLLPDEIQGGTFTITNLGAFGNLTGTPIINQPEVAILALGAIKKRPMVIETNDGDYIGIRHMMIMSLAYDHRVVDGALGGMFLKQVADYLENFDTNRKS